MDLIVPDILKTENNIECLFTASNRTVYNKNETIPGLNLGIHTDADTLQVSENYELLFSKLGWNSNRIALARQVHGNNVKIIDEPGIYDETDGLVTKIPDLPIGIQVADCAAVLIADPHHKIIGAFHAGWRGAVSGIIPVGLEKMYSLNAVPVNCKAYISPCISQRNFEVGNEVADQFPDEFCDRISYKKPHVNLKNFIVHQLLESGLIKKNIETAEACTIEDNRFYSYRRERKTSGRMLGLIKIAS